MRTAFAHEAVLAIDTDTDADDRAPGAAITVELCGHWEHQPPCPLAPHHSRAERVGSDLHVRVLFAAEPDREDEVRSRIDAALAAGQLPGPAGVTTSWALRSSRSTAVEAREAAHAQRLVQG